MTATELSPPPPRPIVYAPELPEAPGWYVCFAGPGRPMVLWWTTSADRWRNGPALIRVDAHCGPFPEYDPRSGKAKWRDETLACEVSYAPAVPTRPGWYLAYIGYARPLLLWWSSAARGWAEGGTAYEVDAFIGPFPELNPNKGRVEWRRSSGS